MPRFVRYLAPLVAFVALAGLLFKGLSLDPRHVPSPLIDKPAPVFSLPLLQQPETLMSNADLKGEVTLLNVWATWCVACRQEHPLLMQLAKQGVRIYGLNYKDKRDDAKRWLQMYGDPYLANAFDTEGRTGIDWGVYGTPETFVVDQQGIIRFKHVGPLTRESIKRDILPMLKQLQENEG